MIDHALTYINLVLCVAVSIWVALQLVQRKSAFKYYFAAFFSLMAYSLLYNWSFRSGAIYAVPSLIYSDIAVSFAIGPIVFAYFNKLLRNPNWSRASALPHYVPALLSACALVVYRFVNPSDLDAYLQARPRAPQYGDPFIRILDVLSDLSVVLYALASAKAVKFAAGSDALSEAKELRALARLLIGVAVSYFGVLCGHVAGNRILLVCAAVANSVMIVWCFLFSHRYPEIAQRAIRDLGPQKRADTAPPGIDVAGITRRLTALMEEQRVYTDPDLTIQSLSTMLGVGSHQLSLVLNDTMGVNFRTYINSHRLAEAKRLLVRHGDRSVLEIAFEVGFNSKTSFNTLFLKETGLSPREYRKRSAAR